MRNLLIEAEVQYVAARVFTELVMLYLTGETPVIEELSMPSDETFHKGEVFRAGNLQITVTLLDFVPACYYSCEDATEHDQKQGEHAHRYQVMIEASPLEATRSVFEPFALMSIVDPAATEFEWVMDDSYADMLPHASGGGRAVCEGFTYEFAQLLKPEHRDGLLKDLRDYTGPRNSDDRHVA